MPKLNDLQSILLATASQRDSGSLYPLPESVVSADTRLTRALAALTKAGFAEERETSDIAAASRTDGDQRLGLYITSAGCAAIGVGESTSADEATPAATAAPATAVTCAPARGTKTAAVLELLSRHDGATLPELIAATGWLPHTTRAALTGLRKKGHAIERLKRDDATCYRIAVRG